MAWILSHADFIINQQSYKQSQCPLHSAFLRDRLWPASEVANGRFVALRFAAHEVTNGRSGESWMTEMGTLLPDNPFTVCDQAEFASCSHLVLAQRAPLGGYFPEEADFNHSASLLSGSYSR